MKKIDLIRIFYNLSSSLNLKILNMQYNTSKNILNPFFIEKFKRV